MNAGDVTMFRGVTLGGRRVRGVVVDIVATVTHTTTPCDYVHTRGPSATTHACTVRECTGMALYRNVECAEAEP